MNKKLLIIAAAIGLISFAGTFFAAKFMYKSQHQKLAGDPALSQNGPDANSVITPSQGITLEQGLIKTTLTEKQLQTLVSEIREKMQEYKFKLQDVDIREQRLKMTQETFKKDIEELENLRTELASAVARLKNEQDKLSKTRVEIEKSEKNNLISIAAAYDKMDSASAGKILTTMSQTQNNNADDAIKILYYMPERTKAKVLASIAETEPAISANFCQKLKQIIEKD